MMADSNKGLHAIARALFEKTKREQWQDSQSELAALRAQLAVAVAALEEIANDHGYKMSQALNEAHMWEMTAKRRRDMARQALAEIRGDDGNN